MNQTEKSALSDKKLLELITDSQYELIYLSAIVSGKEGIARMDEESRRQAEFKRELLKRAARRRRLQNELVRIKKYTCDIGQSHTDSCVLTGELHKIIDNAMRI